MDATLLIGEEKALVLHNNKISSSKLASFDELKDMSYDNIRVISNRSDFEFKIGHFPKVRFWQKDIVKKSYIIGQANDGAYFNTEPRYKKLTDDNKYESQDVSLIPDDITKFALDNLKGNLEGIEHLGLVVPNILNIKGYWMLLSENILGGYTIYLGKDTFLLVSRNISMDLEEAIDTTLSFFERFGYNRSDELSKFSIANNEIDGFKNLYNGFGDKYLLSSLLDLGIYIEPSVGPAGWKHRKCLYNIKKYLVTVLICTSLFFICLNIWNYKRYLDLENYVKAFDPKIKIISNDADDMILKFAKQLKNELDEFKALDEEFQNLRDDIHYTMNHVIYDSTIPQVYINGQKHSKPSKLLFTNDYYIRLLKEIQYLFPKDMTVEGYSYNSNIYNGDGLVSVSFYTKSDESIISKFISNVKSNIKGIKDIVLENDKDGLKKIVITKSF